MWELVPGDQSHNSRALQGMIMGPKTALSMFGGAVLGESFAANASAHPTTQAHRPS